MSPLFAMALGDWRSKASGRSPLIKVDLTSQFDSLLTWTAVDWHYEMTFWVDLVYYAHSGYLCSLELWKNTKLNHNTRSVAITLIWENILSKDINLSSRHLFVLIYIYIIISHPQARAYWAWVMIAPWHHVQVVHFFSNAPSRNFIQLWGAGGSKVSRPPLAPTSNASCERTRNSNILKLKIAWKENIYKHE